MIIHRPILLISILISGICLGQDSDLGMWNSIAVETELTKDVKAGLETELRLDNNISRPYLFFLSPSIQYDLNKHIRIGGAYRFSTQLSDSDQSHRATGEVVFRKLVDFIMKKSRLDASLRLRATHETYGVSRSETIVRSKFAFSYNLPKTKLEPKGAIELFYQFDQQLIYTFEEVRGVSGWDKYRARIGASYPLKKRHELFAFYQFQNGFFNSSRSHTLGLAYTYDLKWK